MFCFQPNLLFILHRTNVDMFTHRTMFAPYRQQQPLPSHYLLQYLPPSTRTVMVPDNNRILRPCPVTDMQLRCVQSIVSGPGVGSVIPQQQQVPQMSAAAALPQPQGSNLPPAPLQQSISSYGSQASVMSTR